MQPCTPLDRPSACCATQLVPEAVVRAYARAMLNIHPALLPAFGGKGLYGARVHRAVIASGARWSGPSVHFVDADYDTGPILAQRVVPVLPTDTPARLAARVLAQARAPRLAPRVRCVLTWGGSRRDAWRPGKPAWSSAEGQTLGGCVHPFSYATSLLLPTP